VLQVYRVTSAFEAARLRRDPLRVESFEPGDLLVMLDSDGSYTTFSRYDQSIELGQQETFVVDDNLFQLSIETL
jgi:hypothetical protein